ncbi:MAG: hypothetical protein P8Z76_18335, partial [Alphaproteobacteria bacterium]
KDRFSGGFLSTSPLELQKMYVASLHDRHFIRGAPEAEAPFCNTLVKRCFSEITARLSIAWPTSAAI